MAMDTMRNGGGFLAYPIPAGERRFEIGSSQGVFGDVDQPQLFTRWTYVTGGSWMSQTSWVRLIHGLFPLFSELFI